MSIVSITLRGRRTHMYSIRIINAYHTKIYVQQLQFGVLAYNIKVK